MAYDPDQVWRPGKVRTRAAAKDQFEGLRGHDYIKARGLNKKEKRIEPDAAALEIAHRILSPQMTLAQMLASPTLRPVLENVARQHMRRREMLDVKKLQSGDDD